MLTFYRFLQVLVVLATAAVVYACKVYVLPLWYIPIPFGVYLAIVGYGAYFIHSGLFVKAILRGNTKESKIAITFDDGPHPEHTPAILKILKEHQVKATFFCIGERIEENLELMKQIIEEGHIVGNHSWGHGFWFDLQSAHSMQIELNKTNHIVQQRTGLLPHFFRPPYGVTNPNLAKAIKNTNMATIGWSLRSMDTAIKDEERLLKRITKRVSAGDIVLFHDTQSGTVSALPAFLKHCKEQGLEIVPLDKLTKKPAYE
jgi:peptidoglycan/xylan/chitin deacetylase (PgdA/CDA1 family)